MAQFKGITVAQDTELRAEDPGNEQQVSRCEKYARQDRREGHAGRRSGEVLEGSTSIAYNNTDPVALAKALTAYAKANPVFVFKAGWSKDELSISPI